jgi:hypothetical protein
MYRSYRMRYGSPSDSIEYTPIRIIVKMMTGVEHTLFTENDNETFLDVKRALLSYISPKSVLRQLVFQSGNNEIGYNSVDDLSTVSSLVTPQTPRIVELELLLINPTYPDQQRIIDMTKGEKVYVNSRYINTPDEIEAFRWSLLNNSSIKLLSIKRISRVLLPTIMDVLRESTSIQRLELDGYGVFNVDDTAELFHIIGENNSLHFVHIEDCSYRLSDLTQLLLRNTSLTELKLVSCDIEVDDDTSIIKEVLEQHQHTLKHLTLDNNNIEEDEDEVRIQKVRDIFFSLGADNTRNISLRWENPNL